MVVRRKNPNIQISNDPVFEEPVVEKNRMGMWGWVGVIFALLCVYWWKSNTWPIIAIAGGRPIFRYSVNQDLYRQGGKSVVDTIVTENLVNAELKKGKVKVSDSEVNGKLTEIKKNFPSDVDFESALKDRNMTLVDLKKQISLQLRIEKLLSDRIEVSASDTAKFIKEMGTLLTSTTSADKEKEAVKLIKEQKLQTEINNWIEEIRTKGKVWWIGKV